MRPKNKEIVLPLLILLSKKILTIITAISILIVFLLIYRSHSAHNEINKLSQSPSPSVFASSSPLYTTPINRPAEQCSLTSSSETWDTYTCMHFIFQLPKGWYGDYMIGQDKTLSYSEFYNYDFTRETGQRPGYYPDQGQQKIYLILYLSSKNVNEYVSDQKNLTRKEYKEANFSVTPLIRNSYNGLKVVITGAYHSPNTFYVIRNPSKTVILTFGNIFGVDDTLLEEIFSTIKFTDSGN